MCVSHANFITWTQVSGYASNQAETNGSVWPLYVFSCIMQIMIMSTLIRHLYAAGQSADVHPVENRV
jgi:hypothetical protein